jgi:uncharacterized protein
LRQGFCFQCDDKDLAEAIHTRWEELGLVEFLWRLWTFERAYGGGAGLLGVNDGNPDLTQPLNVEKAIKFEFLTPLEPVEVVPVEWYNDPSHKKFGLPSLYQINPISPGGTTATSGLFTTKVHESRFVIFPGIRVSRRAFSGTSGWGDSILTRLDPVLRDFQITWESAAVLVTDFSQAIFKMKNLVEIVGTDNNNAFKNRMQAIDYGRSVLRAIVIDQDEDFERKTTSLTSLPEILDRFATRLAAAADMPLTLLMGQSPAGLNATGASDIRFFYDRIKAVQVQKLRPVIEYVTRILLQTMGKPEPENWSIDFHPLWQPTDKEKAEARYIQAQTDNLYLTQQVLSPEEVALSRFGGDEYSAETIVDFKARDNMEPAVSPTPDKQVSDERASDIHETTMNPPEDPEREEKPPKDDKDPER